MATFDPAANSELSEALEGVFAEELEQPGPAPAEASEPIISFSHVSIGFDGRPVLEDVSFSVDRGQTLCILGRSGVGKSVALRLLMGFLKPDSGTIHLEGQEITGLSEDGMQAIRKRVTMVFQNGALFDSLSVRENVAFPLRERGGLVEDQIQQLVDRLIGLWRRRFQPASPLGANGLWPSPVHWRRNPRWCSTTSQPQWWTRSSPAAWGI